jgi:predicted metal-dependent hydrolase
MTATRGEIDERIMEKWDEFRESTKLYDFWRHLALTYREQLRQQHRGITRLHRKLQHYKSAVVENEFLRAEIRKLKGRVT